MEPSQLTTYTLTAASDWKMFVFMVGGVGFIFTFLFGIIGSLVGLMWWDIRRQFSTITGNCTMNRSDCQKRIQAEFKEIWDAFDKVAPRNQTQT